MSIARDTEILIAANTLTDGSVAHDVHIWQPHGTVIFQARSEEDALNLARQLKMALDLWANNSVEIRP